MENRLKLNAGEILNEEIGKISAEAGQDSLDDISPKYGISLEELQILNGIKPDQMTLKCQKC